MRSSIWPSSVWNVTCSASAVSVGRGPACLVHELNQRQIERARRKVLLQHAEDGRLNQEAVVYGDRAHARLHIQSHCDTADWGRTRWYQQGWPRRVTELSIRSSATRKNACSCAALSTGTERHVPHPLDSPAEYLRVADLLQE